MFNLCKKSSHHIAHALDVHKHTHTHTQGGRCTSDKRSELKSGTLKEATAAMWGQRGSHRLISLERTHHLCPFVELSHFNPLSHLGTGPL